MTDSRVASLAALLDAMPREQAQAWVDGDAVPAAEWLIANNVTVIEWWVRTGSEETPQ